MNRKIEYLLFGAIASTAFAEVAQAEVHGALFGRVVDEASGRPVEAVTVVATGPQGDQVGVTDADGRYVIRDLPIGAYVVRFYDNDVVVEQPNVQVSIGKTVRLNGTIPARADQPETITIVQKAPVIDVGSSRVGATLNQEFARNVPNTLTVGGMLEKAPGAFSDPMKLSPSQLTEVPGVSIAGATGAENSYYLDGVNVTSIGYGLLSTDLVSAFVEEVEIATAGYDAEYGRALGGVVNIATKSGGNELHGSVFSYVSPRFLAGDERRVSSQSSVVTGQRQSDLVTHMGAELGGPILKDRLFFWAGYAPELSRGHMNRYVDRFVDEDGDGQADTTPDGRLVSRRVSSSKLEESGTTHQYAGKLTWRLLPEHTLSLGLYGIKRTRDFARSPNMDERVAMSHEETSSRDVSARWISKLLEGRWRLEGNMGLHGESGRNRSPFAEKMALNGVQWFNNPSLSQFDTTPAVLGACAADVTSGFNPCPVQEYQSGGYGMSNQTDADRISAQIKSTVAFRGVGWHQVKFGAEYELNRYDDTRSFTGPDGGRGYLLMNDGYALSQTFFRLKPGERGYMRMDGDETADDPNMDGKRSDLLQQGWYQDRLRAKTETQNTSFFLQESYSPLSHLTLNVGGRMEKQELKDYQGGTPISMDFALSPRLGLVFDPTNEGRAKVYGHWGRFYESIPMDLNNRAFGGEGVLIGVYPVPDLCATPLDKWGDGNPETSWKSCKYQGALPEAAHLFPLAGGENLPVQPKLKGSYSDEIVLGWQYEILPDLTVGTAYIRRKLGRAIEDAMGMVANPGQVDAGVVSDLEKRAVDREAIAGLEGATPGAVADAREARFLADTARQVAAFPKAKRLYEALQFTAARRFSKSWMTQASYTYSRTEGNYPGLYAADKGQLDPNFTSQYDLIDLVLNRDGRLPNDRPHLFRADGYYQFALGSGMATTGLGWVARSGRPVNHLGAHSAYGTSEVFVLPRGMGGRTPAVTRFDLHLGYRFALGAGTSLDAFIDVFNLFNQRTALTVDQNYTLAAVNPIVGGDASDLVHLKDASGNPVTKNPNYGTPTSYQSPIAGRFGLRLSF